MASAREEFADAERLAAALGPLPLKLVRSAGGNRPGQHARRRAGSGSEFWQYRPLQPGEARGRIDWRRSARSDELFVREREREDPVRLVLWIDGSGSMDFASQDDLPEKFVRGRLLLTAIALAAQEADERIAVPGRPDITRAFAAFRALGKAPIDAQAFGTGDVVIAAGDFLDEGSADIVNDLAARGVKGVLLAIADPAEAAFPYTGHTRFERAEESDPEADIGRAEALAGEYRAAWRAHIEKLQTAARAPGWLLVQHMTNAPPETALQTIREHLETPGRQWAA